MDPTPIPKKHVLLVAFPTFGHIIPLLELAKKISKYHDVTFAVSAAKIPQMTKRELTSPVDSVRVFAIEDGVVDDFDDPNDPAAIERVFKGVFPGVVNLLSIIPIKNKSTEQTAAIKAVDVAIVDHFLSAPGALCVKRGLPHYIFQSANAFVERIMLAYGNDSPVLPEDAEDPPFMILPEDGKLLPISAKIKDFVLPMRKGMDFATGHILNSCRDIEIEALREVEKHPTMVGKTIYCVGPLIPEEQSADTVSHQIMEKKVKDWLDRQKSKSVLYVSFGSVGTPKPQQLVVIGRALLEIGQPVIWAIRDKYVGSLPVEISKKIPDQFEDQASKFLVLNWAPQKLILEHESVGVFLSHCGWNSTLEGLIGGKPIVAWPMFADQLGNGEFVVQSGGGELLPNTGIKGPRVVPEKEIKDIIKKVGGWPEKTDSSEGYRKSAQKLANKLGAAWMPGGSSHSAFLSLIQFTE